MTAWGRGVIWRRRSPTSPALVISAHQLMCGPSVPPPSTLPSIRRTLHKPHRACTPPPLSLPVASFAAIHPRALRAGVALFGLVSDFFPFEVAKPSDWRFRKLAEDQSNGIGSCDSIYAMYKRACPFSVPLREMLDSMLTIAVEKRT